jgi:glutathione S-transferase
MINDQAPAILITIPLSHYCEKARWGLDRVGLPYREEAHAPLLSRLATQRSERGTVPVLACGDRRFTDSTDILKFADEAGGGDLLYPRDLKLCADVDELVKWFDRELGPHSRRWAYGTLMPHAKLLRWVWSQRVPRWEAVLVPVMAPLVRRLVARAYRITPENIDASLARVRGVFRKVDELLSNGRRFLLGERFSAADLTFAALAAPMLLPAECGAVLPALDALPAVMREEILRFRESEAGRLALRLYAEERPSSCRAVRAPALARHGESKA